MTKEALRLALEALQQIAHVSATDYEYQQWAVEALTAIKEALEQTDQTNTRPYYTIDELNAWADEKEKQAWRNAAIRIGEELSSVGPDGYYEMDAWKWLDWAMEQEPRGKNSLAQPEQEPVVWMYQDKSTHEVRFQKHMRDFVDHGAWYEVPLYSEPLANQEKTSGSPIKQVLAQSEQEPVAWSYWQSCLNDDGTQTAPWVHRLSKFKPSESIINKDIIPLYTTPPQRTWVGLTDEEIEDAIDDGFAFGLSDGNISNQTVVRYVRIIEAKLKEKNV